MTALTEWAQDNGFGVVVLGDRAQVIFYKGIPAFKVMDGEEEDWNIEEQLAPHLREEESVTLFDFVMDGAETLLINVWVITRAGVYFETLSSSLEERASEYFEKNVIVRLP